MALDRLVGAEGPVLSTAISTARLLILSFLPLSAAGHHSFAEYDFGPHSSPTTSTTASAALMFRALL